MTQIPVAVRRLLRTPTFLVAAFVTLTLALGVVTAGFGVANVVLVQPLPYPEGGRLVDVGYGVPGYGFDRLPFSVGTFVHTEQEQRSFSDFAIYYASDRYNVGLDDPERVPVARVTPGFFSVFRSPPVLGRPFTPEDRRVGAEPVVVVSHALWQRRWGADSTLVGATVHVEGVDRRVVGVTAPGFHFPDRSTGLWVPFTIDPSNLAPTTFGYPGVARLAPGVSLEGARADLVRITEQLPEVYPDRITPSWVEGGQFHSYVRPLKERVVGDLSTQVWLVFGTAALLMLLAAANVANLFVVRAEERAAELALRRALGSGRAGILASVLGESLVVGVVSGAAALGVAAALLDLAIGVAPPDLPRVSEIGLTPGVALLGVGLALALGVVYAGVPLLVAGKESISSVIRIGGRSVTGSRAARRVQGGLVVGQVALAVALSVGAGLLVRSFGNLASVDPGFDASSATTFEIGLPDREYGPEERPAAFQQLADRIARIETVEAVGAAGFLPLSGDFRRGPLHMEGQELPDGESGPVVDLKRVTPGYFEAMGIPVLEGRDLNRDDGPEGFPAAVVNRALVEAHLGEGRAVGRRVRITRRAGYVEIVGVVGDVRTERFDEPPGPHLYLPPGATTPSSPSVPPAMSFVVRSRAAPDRLAPALTEAVAEIDPKLPLGSLRTLESLVEDHLARHRLMALVLLGIGITGVVLAAVGIYGLVAYVVVRRRREMGVRMALGASAMSVIGSLLGRATALALGGAVLGLGLAYLGSRFLESVLFQVAPSDLATYALALVLVTAVVLVASAIPARRAAAGDLRRVLNAE